MKKNFYVTKLWLIYPQRSFDLDRGHSSNLAPSILIFTFSLHGNITVTIMINTAVIFTNTGYCAVFSKTQRGLCLVYGIILDIHVKNRRWKGASDENEGKWGRCDGFIKVWILNLANLFIKLECVKLSTSKITLES